MPRVGVRDLGRGGEVCLVYEWAGADRNAAAVVKYPVQVPCRWVDRKSQTVDSQSNVVDTDADVAVDRDFPNGSIVWKGGFSDVSGTADPPDPGSDFYEVVNATSARDVKGRLIRRELRLRRFRDTLPTVLSAAESLE